MRPGLSGPSAVTTKGSQCRSVPHCPLMAGPHQHGKVHPGGLQPGAELLAQAFGVRAFRRGHYENGREFAGKDGLGHFLNIAARFFEDAG